MKDVLIINKAPFGYLVDSYKWCQHLKSKCHLTYVGIGKPVEHSDIGGLKIISVKPRNNRLFTAFCFISVCLWYILVNRGFTIVVFFDYCAILKRILPWKKMHLDLRTLSVSKDGKAREAYDNMIQKSVNLFDSVSAISKGVIQKLNIVNKPSFILPLGADMISQEKKDYSELHLVYIGTFDGRDLHKTIEGLADYVNAHNNCKVDYHIVGFSQFGEEQKLMDLCNQLGIADYVIFHGRVPHDQLSTVLDKCNIGVSFVPLTEYYDIQPPTKTFEYAMSGLFCIATDTSENRKLISSDNGVLIDDSALAFSEALSYIENHKGEFDEQKIRKSLDKSTWKSIVNDILIPNVEAL